MVEVDASDVVGWARQSTLNNCLVCGTSRHLCLHQTATRASVSEVGGGENSPEMLTLTGV